MSDNMENITELNTDKIPDRRALVKKIVVFVVIVAAVCCSVALFLFNEGLNLDGLRRWGRYLTVRNDENFGVYSFDSHSSNRYEKMGDDLIVASIGGLSAYDKNGAERHVLQKPLELPQLLVSGNMAVAYDVGGSTLLALQKGKGEVLSLEETHPILDADLSSNGAICLSSSASGYKSVLSVYNEEQDLIYRWLSSTTYFPLCALAPNGRDMAAIAMGQTDGVFESSIYLFRTDSEEIQNKISLGNELVYDITFLDSDLMCAVCETGVQYFNMKGEQLGHYSYTDEYLKDFDLGGNGFLTLSTNMYRAGNRYSLTTVNEKGKEIASCYIGEEILDLSAGGRYIAVLTPGKLTIYTQSLHVYHETTQIGSTTAVVMREDGSVLLLGSGQGNVYIP